MSTALQLMQAVFRQAKLDQSLLSFSTSQDFPYNIALDTLNQALMEMNRMGSWWFTETDTALTYSAGVYQYTLSSLNIQPNQIVRVRRTATNYWGELNQFNWKDFQIRYRQTTIPTTQPNAFAKYSGVLELDVKPDQDYSLVVSHYRDMPIITSTSDTFLIPATDEDVLIAGAFAILLQRIGRPDFQNAFQIFQLKSKSLLGKNAEDLGLPKQMPAAF